MPQNLPGHCVDGYFFVFAMNFDSPNYAPLKCRCLFMIDNQIRFAYLIAYKGTFHLLNIKLLKKYGHVFQELILTLKLLHTNVLLIHPT